MYLIIYQKRNGDIIERYRNTRPDLAIGEESSMGWVLKDIKYNFNNKYYSHADYKKLLHKQYKMNNIKNKILSYIKIVSQIGIFIILFPIYDYLKIIL